MAKKHPSSKQEDIRKIGKVGGYSYSITIPKALIQNLGWREHQKVVVTQEGDALVIRDWKPRRTKGKKR